MENQFNSNFFLTFFKVYLSMSSIATTEDALNKTALLFVCVTLDSLEETAAKVKICVLLINNKKIDNFLLCMFNVYIGLLQYFIFYSIKTKCESNK